VSSTKAEQLVGALRDAAHGHGSVCDGTSRCTEDKIVYAAEDALLAYISELEADRERIEWLEASVDDRHEVRVRPVTALGGRHVCIDAIGLHENGSTLRDAIDAARNPES
jgi:hypothetical protein